MVTRDFSQRSTQTELMDTESISFAEFHDCLRQLETINILTLAYRPTLQWFKRMLADPKSEQLMTVLDIGCGSGDMLRRIQKWMQTRNFTFELVGIDLNPWSKQSAELVTPKDVPIRFETSNLFALDPALRADFIISSLFAHHLTDNELIHFLQWMDAHTMRGWFINDLHRHWLPFYFIKWVVRLLSRNRLIIHDAPISVARAFTASDWRYFLMKADIPKEQTRVEWFFPFRYGISCRKA